VESDLSTSSSDKTAEGLVGRLFESSLGMFDVMSVHLGDRLGLYQVLHDHGPTTSVDLAGRAGINERYAVEWLEQQAVTGILEVDGAEESPQLRRYRLPAAYAEPLLNRDSPNSIAPLGRSVLACALAMPALIDACRSGGGVDWSMYGPDMIESQGDFNRPWLVNSFGTELLPAIAPIHGRLISDPPALVADVACGVGWAAIAIARAYPEVRVDGFDLDPSSIAIATENARRAGVGDRVSFATRDAADPSAVGRYDLVVIIEAVHDVSRPIDVLAAVRRMLRPDGSALIADEKTEDEFIAPGSDLERMFYGFSVFTCLPAAMTERPTAATGTVMRASTMRDYAAQAGFGGFERLDEPALDTLRFYRLTP
jgi:2-polyprenyl-3-methyl-5-hydroxy-6-metoxy-1,4-benzoquinol methylase